MKSLPTRPNFAEDSERYFLWTYRKAIDEQHPIVEMNRWKLPDLMHPRDEIIESWESKGLGRILREQDAYGEEFLHFSLNDNGIRFGKKLERQFERNRAYSRLRRNALPVFTAIAVFIAALAASASAYFSYLALPGN